MSNGERELLVAGLLAVFAIVSSMLCFRLKLVAGYPATPVPPVELAQGLPALLFQAGLIGKLLIALPVIAVGTILVSATDRKRMGSLAIRIGFAALILGVLGASLRFQDAHHMGRRFGGAQPLAEQWLPVWRLFREATATLAGGVAISLLATLTGIAIRWVERRRGGDDTSRGRTAGPEDLLATIALTAVAVAVTFVALDRERIVRMLTAPGFGMGDYRGYQAFIQISLVGAILLIVAGWRRTLRRGSSAAGVRTRYWRAGAVLYGALLLLLLTAAINALQGLDGPLYEREMEGEGWRTFLGALLNVEGVGYPLLGFLAVVVIALVFSFTRRRGPGWLLPVLPAALLAICGLIFAVKTAMACHIIGEQGWLITPRDVSATGAVTGGTVLLAGFLLPAILLAGRAIRRGTEPRCGAAGAATALGLVGLAAGLAAYVLEFHSAWDTGGPLPPTPRNTEGYRQSCHGFLAHMTDAASWLLAGAVLWVTGMVLAGLFGLSARRQTRSSESSVP